MIYYIRNDVDDLLGFKYNDNIYYYIKNIQDDIIGIIDSNNNIIANYKYDSWGNIISITDNNGNDISNNTNHIANINPFRYRSYYYDTETNLYYLNSRYYNPTWGRFINADGIIGANEDIISYNLYNYCSNNPVMYTDDNGTGMIASIINTVKKTSAKVAKVVKPVSTVVSKATKKVASTFKNIVNTASKSTTSKKGVNSTSLPDYTEELNKVLISNTSQALIISNTFSGPSVLNYFYQQVKPNGPWDYKLESKWEEDIDVPFLGYNGKFLYNGKVTTAEDFGNINYGFIGTAMGIDPKLLYMGGGYAAQGISIEIIKSPYYGDSINDNNSITRGINMFYNWE